MGEVYRAVDTRLDRSVAVKILPAEYASNAQFRLRFEREAKLISSLSHPHICTLHDVGETDGVSYLVMELLEGETLADRIARGPLPVGDVLTIGIQIASALDRAHRRGIVHRDLKPGNIMLTKSGVKLLDFGLAKSGGMTLAAPSDATEHKPLTSEGTILGTFQYMAPEQLEGAEADPRSDLFAFGAVLYEMTTGRRAFEGKTRTSLIAAIVQGQPAPVSEVRPLAPKILERLIAACLAKDPEERVQSAHDVLLQLKWIREAGEEPAEVPRRTNRGLRVAALLLVAIAAGLAGWALRREKPHASYSFTIPIATPDYRNLGAGGLSPDGRMLAFQARDTREAKQYLWLRRFDSIEVRKIAGTEAGTFICWSPDSRFLIFYGQGGNIMKVSVEDGSLQTIARERSFVGAMNEEGVLIIAPLESGLKRLDMVSGRIFPLTKLNASRREFAHMAPSFLPDGKRFLFVARSAASVDEASRMTLFAASLENGEVHEIGDVTSAAVYAEPGYVLSVREGSLIAQPFDADELRYTGPPQTILDPIAQVNTSGAFSVSNNGVLVARPPRRSQAIRRVDATGKLLEQIGDEQTMNYIRVSPDGQRVLASFADIRLGSFDIWSRGLRRPTGDPVIAHPAHDQHGVWSRDGTRIYFSSDRQGYPDIYVAPVDRSEEPRPVLGGPGTQAPVDITPDGKHLLYVNQESERGTTDLWIAPLDDPSKGRPFVTAPRIQGDARFSPDGRYVSYLSNEAGPVEVYVRPFPGPGPARQVSIEGAERPPLWSRDGRSIYFATMRKVYRSSFDPATGSPSDKPELMFELPYEITSWDIDHTDGSFIIAMVTDDFSAPPLNVVIDWPRLLKK